MDFHWQPDPETLAGLLPQLVARRDLKTRIRRKFRGGGEKDGLVSLAKLSVELPLLDQIDLDFFYRPGNPDVRQWGSVDLNVKHRTAHVRVIGDRTKFAQVFDLCIARLRLVKTERQLLDERLEIWRSALDDGLFVHIRGALHDGNLPSALSAAVVYVEDRLRQKIGAAGIGMTGSDLALYAYKSPGVFMPPLSGATNSQDSAFLMIKGWIGLVRNLHGHNAGVIMTLDEAHAQLMGLNYILWVIEKSTIKP